MVQTLRDNGLLVHAQNNRTISALNKALRAGEAVMVCYTEPILGWGHYAIVRKITDKKIFLLDSDSETGNTTLLLKEFKRRWHDPMFTKTTRWAAMVGTKSPQKRRL